MSQRYQPERLVYELEADLKDGFSDMDDLLKPVKTVRNVKSNIEKFETLALRESQPKIDVISTKKIISDISNGSKGSRNGWENEDGREQSANGNDIEMKDATSGGDIGINKSPVELVQSVDNQVSSPEQALVILKEQPADEVLEAVLRYLDDGIQRKHDFNIHIPSATAAQILNVLVISIIPDRWAILSSAGASKQDKEVKKLLLSCMNSTAGIGVLVARLQTLITSSQLRQPGSSQNATFKDTALFLASMLYHKTFIRGLVSQVQSSGAKPGQQQAVWVEATSLLAGSRILNVFQEASTISEVKDHIPSWLQDPKVYSRWLGGNIASAATTIPPNNEEAWKMLANFLKRALSLGQRDELVSNMYTQLVLGERALWTPLHLLSSYLPRLDQKIVLELMLQDLSRKLLSTRFDKDNDISVVVDGKEAIGGVAAIVSGFIGDNEYLEGQLIDWLTGTSTSYAPQTLQARRAMILILAAKEERLQILLEKSMKNFSDKLHIKHDSVLQQEALAQVILLTAGYLHRVNSKYMFELSRSSSYLHAVSNRLAASLPQARFLGMIVGMAISRLVDPPDKQMKFDTEEMESQEAKWWFSLTNIEDVMGSVEAVKKLATDGRSPVFLVTKAKKKLVGLVSSKPRPQAQTSKIISIEEVEDDSETEDELIPYQKPDDDPEDSDEDPTLINRLKPKPPVYINDLIKSLNVIDEPEVIEVALKTAPSLIRRKANFGTELSENIENVASALINLQGGMSNLELQELRLQSLVACLVAQPTRMGPWFASIYFEGDFSLSQRATILTVIGLSSRELAGHKDEGTPSTFPTPLPPSKQLPPHLASLYTTNNPINTLTSRIQHNTLRPLALAAVDKATGPSVLKLRTFSSRLAVEARTAERQKERTLRIPKDLHKILSESIYLPLCCRLSILLSPHGSSSTLIPVKTNTLFDPQILALFLKTLTIILTTLGPYAMQLHTLTRETLLLLTGLTRNAALWCDAAVLPAMLTLLLVVLDVNVAAGGVREEELVTVFGGEVVGLVRWVGDLVEGGGVRVPEGHDGNGGGGGGDMPWTMVAAAIQVKWAEVGRKFQGTLMGIAGLDTF